MAKLSKEQRAYLDGMAHALKIAKEDGIDGLEKELRFRGIQSAPLNVSSKELIMCAMEYAHEYRIGNYLDCGFKTSAYSGKRVFGCF